MYKIIFFFLLQSLFFNAFAQTNNENLTGVLHLDNQLAFDITSSASEGENNSASKKKSPLLAGLFSLAIPGAGEFYSGSYLKSILFIGIEAAAITVGLIYDKKGDDQTVVFENYADKFWDPAKYARWTIDNLEDHLNQVLNNNLKAENYTGLFYDEERTKVNWSVLNRLESDIGGWYSHRLERFGEQQYYEMIGKYPQFNPGWSDFDENFQFVYTNQRRDPVTDKFEYYSQLRGKANDYYDIASTAVIIVVVNHIISAADAAWTASRYNKNLSVNMSLEKTQLGYSSEYYPQLNMKLNF